MSNETHDESASRFTGRAPALRPSVPLYRHMLYGSGLTHPLDYVVLAHIHFMCEDGVGFTVQDIIDALRHEGIRNANGKGGGLVGNKAVYESIARLREAGFVHRSQDNGGNFGKVSYTFHEFPCVDPNWTPPQKSETPEDLPVPLTGEAVPASNSVPAGQTASPHKASADKASADRRSGKRRVPAGQAASPHRRSGDAPPPLPPGGGGGSSPYPLHDGARPHPEPEGEGAFSDEETAAVAAFLEELPDPWLIGERDAQRIAPSLLAQMRRKGWPPFLDADHAALTACLTVNPGGIDNPMRVLERNRIANLPAYKRAARPAKGAQKAPEVRCERHPAFPEDCVRCRREERERAQRGRSEPAKVDGAGLLARLRAGLPAQ